MMDTERRNFLKSAAMAAAGSMIASGTSLPVIHADEGVADLPDGDGLNWNKAPCRFCGTGCHVQVGVEEGRVVAIAGDKAADVNKGLLCVKGYHVGGILYGKDRLTKPLLRKDGKLTEIAWDEAIEIVAQRIFDSPKTFAFYGSGQWTIPRPKPFTDLRPVALLLTGQQMLSVGTTSLSSREPTTMTQITAKQPTSAGQLIDILDVGTKDEPKPKMLVQTEPINVMRLVLPAGKAIPEHKAAKQITVQCVDGEVDFTTMGSTLRMTPGKMLYLAPGELHSLTALQDSIMLVTKLN